jgi:hypothetical protein
MPHYRLLPLVIRCINRYFCYMNPEIKVYEYLWIRKGIRALG